MNQILRPSGKNPTRPAERSPGVSIRLGCPGPVGIEEHLWVRTEAREHEFSVRRERPRVAVRQLFWRRTVGPPQDKPAIGRPAPSR